MTESLVIGRIVSEPHRIWRFYVLGKPIPKARARVMRGGWTFTPKRTRLAELAVRMAALEARQTVANRHRTASKSPFRVICRFYGPNALADLDNLLKLVLDATKGVFWEDDRQVVELAAFKYPCEKKSERTEVEIKEL